MEIVVDACLRPSLSLPLSQEGEEIPDEGAVSCCSLPAGTDRPSLSACLQISYRDVICLAAWLNAHLLTPLRLCVRLCVFDRECVCVCVDSFRLLTAGMASPSLSAALRLQTHIHTENDRWIFTRLTRHLQIISTLLIFLGNNMPSTRKHTHKNRQAWLKRN